MVCERRFEALIGTHGRFVRKRPFAIYRVENSRHWPVTFVGSVCPTPRTFVVDENHDELPNCCQPHQRTARAAVSAATRLCHLCRGNFADYSSGRILSSAS